MPCSPPNAFWSIVGHAKRQTAGPIGPFTMERSKRPLGVDAMTVQDRQRRSARQGAEVVPWADASVRPALRQAVAADGCGFRSITEAGDQRTALGDGGFHGGERQRRRMTLLVVPDLGDP